MSFGNGTSLVTTEQILTEVSLEWFTNTSVERRSLPLRGGPRPGRDRRQRRPDRSRGLRRRLPDDQGVRRARQQQHRPLEHLRRRRALRLARGSRGAGRRHPCLLRRAAPGLTPEPVSGWSTPRARRRGGPGGRRGAGAAAGTRVAFRPRDSTSRAGTSETWSCRSRPAAVTATRTRRSSSGVAAAGHEAGLLEPLEDRGEGAGVEPEPTAQLADGHRLAVVPEGEEREVLRIGQPEVPQERPVGPGDRPAGGVQREAELGIEVELGVTGHTVIIPCAIPLCTIKLCT